MSSPKKFYVRWREVHEIEVIADSEEAAIASALRKSNRDNRDSTDDPIAIAA